MILSDVYLLLSAIPGVCSLTISKLEDSDIDFLNIVDEKDSKIINIKNINSNIKKNIVKYKSKAYLDEVKSSLEKNSIKYVCINDYDYPNNLKNIYNPPKVLFYKGDIKVLKNSISIAMVGARKCTQYGKYCAINLAKELSNLGINIISGLAMGIDSYSHEGSFLGKGKTIAVIASSVDNIMPKINLKLADKILQNNGVILSEYYIGHKVHPSNFVKRNRILSGISDGVIVVEAAKKSGSLITADFSLEQGRSVFSVPGNINSTMSQGCNDLIKQGAKLVSSIDDILEEYNIIKNNNENKFDKKYFSEYSLKILDIIKEKGVLSIDEICEVTKFDIKTVNANINELLLKDFIIEVDNRNYSLNV